MRLTRLLVGLELRLQRSELGERRVRIGLLARRRPPRPSRPLMYFARNSGSRSGRSLRGAARTLAAIADGRRPRSSRGGRALADARGRGARARGDRATFATHRLSRPRSRRRHGFGASAAARRRRRAHCRRAAQPRRLRRHRRAIGRRGRLRRGPRPARLAARTRFAWRPRRTTLALADGRAARPRSCPARPARRLRRPALAVGSDGAAAGCDRRSTADVTSGAASAARPRRLGAAHRLPARRRSRPARQPARLGAPSGAASATSGVTSTAPASVIGASVAAHRPVPARRASASPAGALHSRRMRFRRRRGVVASRRRGTARGSGAASAASPCDSRARAAPTRNPRPSSRRATSSRP